MMTPYMATFVMPHAGVQDNNPREFFFFFFAMNLLTVTLVLN